MTPNDIMLFAVPIGFAALGAAAFYVGSRHKGGHDKKPKQRDLFDHANERKSA